MTGRILAHRHRLITEENSRWWTLAAMCFALFMLMLDNTVVNVALPSIQRDLHATLSGLEWTINAYTLTLAVLMVTGGRLGDIFGRRRMFLFGVVVFGASSLIIGFAPNEAVLALIEGNSWHWGSARIASLFAFAVISLAAFVQIELRSRAPIVNFSFFRSRSFLGSNLVAFFVTFAMFSQFFFLTLYMQNVLGYTPLETGLRFLPATLLIIVSGPIAGRLADRVGPRPLMTLGLLLVSSALAIQSGLTIHSGYGLLLPGFMLM